jgi:hypothetical protein
MTCSRKDLHRQLEISTPNRMLSSSLDWTLPAAWCKRLVLEKQTQPPDGTKI